MQAEIAQIKADRHSSAMGALGLLDVQKSYVQSLRKLKEDQERLGLGIDKQIRDNFEY
jgi:hypothetical protein